MQIRSVTSHLAALLLLGITGASGLAQDTTTAEPPAETGEADQPEADPPTGAEDATEAPAEPAAAAEITTTVHGDWELRCNADRSNCFMYQLARDESLNPVAEINIVSLAEGGDAVAGVTVVTPLGTLLSEGVVLQIDSGRARQYTFGWCTRSGCFARFGLTPDELQSMKRGNTARMRIASVSAPQRPILLQISLAGFTSAFDDMSR